MIGILSHIVLMWCVCLWGKSLTWLCSVPAVLVQPHAVHALCQFRVRPPSHQRHVPFSCSMAVIAAFSCLLIWLWNRRAGGIAVAMVMACLGACCAAAYSETLLTFYTRWKGALKQKRQAMPPMKHDAVRRQMAFLANAPMEGADVHAASQFLKVIK